MPIRIRNGRFSLMLVLVLSWVSALLPEGSALHAESAPIVHGPSPVRLALEPGQITFLHQDNVEPWDASPCSHKLSTVGLFEWDVVCFKNGNWQKYAVHLVLSRYERTAFGGAGYELLYWITDWADPRSPRSTSTSMFIHLAKTEEKALVVDAVTGIENDMAGLRLSLDLR